MPSTFDIPALVRLWVLDEFGTNPRIRPESFDRLITKLSDAYANALNAEGDVPAFKGSAVDQAKELRYFAGLAEAGRYREVLFIGLCTNEAIDVGRSGTSSAIERIGLLHYAIRLQEPDEKS